MHKSGSLCFILKAFLTTFYVEKTLPISHVCLQGASAMAATGVRATSPQVPAGRQAAANGSFPKSGYPNIDPKIL